MTNITSVFTGQFILGCWAVFLLFWIVTSFFTKKTIEKRGMVANGILIRLIIGIAVILIVGLRVPWLSQAHFWEYSTAVGVVADVIAVCGLLLMLWSRVVLGRNWSANVVLKENHELIDSGPYALVRHPIYTGLLLLFLGEAVWYGTFLWFLLFIGVFIGVWYKSQQEEKLLMTHFPEAYASYKKRAKALIPFIF